MLTSNLLANFIIGVVFLNALGALGGSVTFAIFLGLVMVSLFFIYRLAPEIKWRQLESIRHYWYNGGRWPEEAEARP
jgi:SP family galactose:H+ symporter-like MFS transporter